MPVTRSTFADWIALYQEDMFMHFKFTDYDWLVIEYLDRCMLYHCTRKTSDLLYALSMLNSNERPY